MIAPSLLLDHGSIIHDFGEIVRIKQKFFVVGKKEFVDFRYTFVFLLETFGKKVIKYFYDRNRTESVKYHEKDECGKDT
jgi:hypothetical protein